MNINKTIHTELLVISQCQTNKRKISVVFREIV